MSKKLFLFTLLVVGSLNLNVKAISLDSIQNSCPNKMMVADDLFKDSEFVNDVEEYLEEVYGKEYKTILEKNAHSVNLATKIEQTFKKNSSDKVSFPNYYGGMYINENDNLVIQIVKSNVPSVTSSQYESYGKMINLDDSIETEYVTYTYEELERVHDIIFDYFWNNEKSIVKGLYIDVRANQVVVELKNNNEENIQKFKDQVIDAPFIRYEDAKEFVNAVNPGSGIYLGEANGTSQYCSWGYRARNSSGQTGMITAAHCLNRAGFSYIEPYTVLKEQNYGTIDAAWISVSNPTNTLNQKPPFSDVVTLSTSVPNIITGQKIAKLGITTGYTIGEVRNTNYSRDYGTYFTDLVLADLPAGLGDSGGIVMEQNSVLGQGFGTMGIVKASLKGTTTMVFCKASNINSIFGISRY